MSAPTARLSTAAWAERALWALRGSRMAGGERVSRESLAKAIHFPLLVFEARFDHVLDLVVQEDAELGRMVCRPGHGLGHAPHPGCTAVGAQAG